MHSRYNLFSDTSPYDDALVGDVLRSAAAERALRGTTYKVLRPVVRLAYGLGRTFWDIFSIGTKFVLYPLPYLIFAKDEALTAGHELISIPRVVREIWREGVLYKRPIEIARQTSQNLFQAFTVFRYHYRISLKNLFTALHRPPRRGPHNFHLLIYIGGLALLSLATYTYSRRRYHNTKSEVEVLHRTVVITGAGCGIGYELAFQFAKRGAFVILTAPDLVKARKAKVDLSVRLRYYIEKARKEYYRKVRTRYLTSVVLPPHLDYEFVMNNIVEMELDLSSAASIYNCVTNLFDICPDGVDILINNAAVNIPPEEMVLTDEDLEVHFSVNYFGHYVLTNLLMPLIVKRTGARIITVTCKTKAEEGYIELAEYIEPYLGDDLPIYLPDEYAYANSKLANCFFSWHLAKELIACNVNNVSTYCVCPGPTQTFLDRYTKLNWLEEWYEWIFRDFLRRKPTFAVQTILHCALSPSVSNETGLFYENCKQSKLFILRQSQPLDELAQDLWDASHDLMLKNYPELVRICTSRLGRKATNVHQESTYLFLYRRDVMTFLMIMEESYAFQAKLQRDLECSDPKDPFAYESLYISGGKNASVIEQWVLYNSPPGFRDLLKEYDIYMRATKTPHFRPVNNGRLTTLQFMESMVHPLGRNEIEEIENAEESEEELDDPEFAKKEWIDMEDLLWSW